MRQKRLGQCRLMLRKHADAEEPLRDALATFEKRQGDSVVRYETESLLGSALAGQKNTADAEALLVHSATALKDRTGDASAAVRQAAIAAVQRLVDLYEACDRHEDAAQWRKELARLESPES
jgi:hypothetical protein